MNSGKILLVTTTSIKIGRVTQGYPLQAALYRHGITWCIHPITQYGPKHNCTSRTQQNYSFKRKCHKNTQQPCWCIVVLFITARKRILIN